MTTDKNTKTVISPPAASVVPDTCGPFTRDCLSIWYQALLVFLGSSFILRLLLIVTNFDQMRVNSAAILPALAVGILFDLLTALWVLLPFTVIMAVAPNGWIQSKPWRWAVTLSWFGFLFLLVYLGVIEYFFFREYNSRFNCIAVDYLVFPHEVFVEIWDGYPVAQATILDAILAASLLWGFRRRILKRAGTPAPRKTRLSLLATVALLVTIGTATIGPGMAHVSDNRMLNEAALNGLFSFVSAALTSGVQYDQHYARMSEKDAFARAQNLIRTENMTFVYPSDSLSLDRRVLAEGPVRPLNVVIILEESFGAQYVTSLDSSGPEVTPEFAKLADSGLLFSNFYAVGNRTVRGLEAVLLSTPPSPGQSIIRRPDGRHLFSLPALLKAKGYQTTFIYGGLSYFDDMRDFSLGNGVDRVFDRAELKKQTFSTVWGLCDEDLFDNSLTILDSLQSTGRPFFSLIVTVSNHSPFTYPKGRIDADPDKHSRENTVRYMDYALGRFIGDARSHPFFDSTLFVVLGDHGPKVTGSPQIPMKSYHIPLLIYGPKVIPPGQRVATLGSQIDVAPTIMGLLNQSYVSEFFGRDLMRVPADSGLALLSLNRDIALARNSSMAVLGLRQEINCWRRDPISGDLTWLPGVKASATIGDAIALYETADYLYRHHRLHMPDQTIMNAAPSAATPGPAAAR